ncbi:MAG: hypothetical protein QXH08_04505 [Candidatus Hadarchaeales archaeon]
MQQTVGDSGVIELFEGLFSREEIVEPLAEALESFLQLVAFFGPRELRAELLELAFHGGALGF